MGPLIAPRRQFLQGLASLAVCAPAVVRASTLMEVSARFCVSSDVTAEWSTADALALLQHEMERRFAETLFGAENLSAEGETSRVARSPVVADAKITALWELRMLFGLRGSPPKLLQDLPPEVQAGISSMFGSRADGSSSLRRKAARAPFDNPSLSWNMTGARSLDCARG
jgi:hypothetical protein